MGGSDPSPWSGADSRLYVLLEKAAGEPDAGNPHVRFDEGEEESDEYLHVRASSLLYTARLRLAVGELHR